MVVGEGAYFWPRVSQWTRYKRERYGIRFVDKADDGERQTRQPAGVGHDDDLIVCLWLMSIDDLIDVGSKSKCKVGQKDGPAHHSRLAVLPSDPYCRNKKN